MKKFLQGKAKILFLCLFVVLTCTACSNPRGKDGKTKVDQIIASEVVKVEKGKVNVSEIEDEKLAKQYAKLKDTDIIEIQPKAFKDSFKDGWFEGLIVWPIAQLINKISSITGDAGFGIICSTILIQVILFLFTRKSQMSSQLMQEIQPELQRITDKYKDKTDDQSKMRMYQEQQALYKKYDIHPIGSLLVTFIQLPVMMGMYYATMRAAAVLTGTFLGISLQGTPMEGFKTFNIAYIVIYVLMIVCQLVSIKLPQWLKKYDDKRNNVKKKTYAEPEKSGMDTASMTMYMSTAMIAFLYLSWPIAMAFYWLVTSLYRICQTIVLHQLMKKQK